MSASVTSASGVTERNVCAFATARRPAEAVDDLRDEIERAVAIGDVHRHREIVGTSASSSALIASSRSGRRPVIASRAPDGEVERDASTDSATPRSRSPPVH